MPRLMPGLKSCLFLAPLVMSPLLAQEVEKPAARAATPEPDSWPSFRGVPSLRGEAAGSLAAKLERVWTYTSGGAITSSPVVADSVVYVGSDDGSLHAVDLETGEKNWTYATEDIIEAPPLVLLCRRTPPTRM